MGVGSKDYAEHRQDHVSTSIIERQCLRPAKMERRRRAQERRTASSNLDEARRRVNADDVGLILGRQKRGVPGATTDIHDPLPGTKTNRLDDGLGRWQQLSGNGFVLSEAPIRRQTLQRNEIEAQADELLRHSQDYQLLRQIPGIGPINALTIIAEAGDLRRFHHHRQFLKFCGLDLSTQQSGQYRGQTRLSKFGNARLRRTLWIAGQVAIRQRENGFRHKFERYIARDRDNPDLRRKAMTAITAKMARVVHAVIKGGSDYRPFVEGRVPGGRTSVS